MTAIHKVGQFSSFQQWVNNARSWIGGTNYLCVDSAGRRCRIGADMMLADKEGKFPVYFGPPIVSRPIIIRPDKLSGPPSQIWSPIKVQPAVGTFWGMDGPGMRFYTSKGKERQTVAVSALDKFTAELAIEHCQHGRIGDILYVQESYRSPAHNQQLVAYRSDGWAGAVFQAGDGNWYRTHHGWLVCAARKKDGRWFGDTNYGLAWKPARTMPERFARLRLEITDIRIRQAEEANWQHAFYMGFRCDAHAGTDNCTHLCGDQLVGKWRTCINRNPWCWVLDVKALPDPMPPSITDDITAGKESTP